MLPSFARQTVTVRRAPYTEQRGTKVRDWSKASEHDVPGCSFQAGTGSTTWTDDRHPITVDAVLYAPPGADIADGDRIVAAGAEYSIQGAPVAWQSPTGSVDHVEVRLVTWRG